MKECVVLGDQSPRGRPGVGEGAATALAREEKPRNRRLNESNTTLALRAFGSCSLGATS